MADALISEHARVDEPPQAEGRYSLHISGGGLDSAILKDLKMSAIRELEGLW